MITTQLKQLLKKCKLRVVIITVLATTALGCSDSTNSVTGNFITFTNDQIDINELTRQINETEDNLIINHFQLSWNKNKISDLHFTTGIQEYMASSFGSVVWHTCRATL